MLFGKFIDETYPATGKYGRGTYIYSYRTDRRLKITTLYLFLSNDGELAVCVNRKKIFPSDGTFTVVGAMIKVDLPEPIELRPGDTLDLYFKNNSGANNRVIAGLVGVLE